MKITIDGQTIEITEEESAVVQNIINKAKQKPISPFTRVNDHEIYYSITSNGELFLDVEKDYPSDRTRYDIANYCTDKKLMQQRAYEEILNRKLWRFACENGELDNEWASEKLHYKIYYDTEQKEFDIDYNTVYRHVAGTIYFPSKEIAEIAIEEIIKPFMKEHPDYNIV